MRALLAAGVAALAVVAAPAHAATPRVVGVVAGLYAPSDQTVDAGDPLTLVNVDNQPHDVTAVDTGPDGWPLFKSPTLYQPGTAPVGGVESLPPGTYQFYCSVHEYMRGTVTVA